MRVLIIGEFFFGYANRIKKQLEKRKIETDLVFAYTVSSIDRAKRKILGKEPDEITYYKKLLKSDENYDVVLVINGKNLPDYFVQQLKIRYPSAKKVLYVWDDLKNLQQSREFFDIFDKKYTYSKFDADHNPQFEFQPFFFTHESNVKERIIGASFVGSLHSDRYQTLKHFKKMNPRVKFFFYLYSDFISYLKYVKRVRLSDVKFKTLSYDHYIGTVAESQALIELPHPDQKNITTRAIEILGTRTKLITTSDAVKNYDFYNDTNIFVVTNSNSAGIQNWLQQDYKDYPVEVIRKYHIDTWLDVILK